MRTGLAFPCLAAALAACAPPSGANGQGALELTVRPVELATSANDLLEFAGAVMIRTQDPRFGGLSGLALGPDGTRFVAISDAGYWAEGELHRRYGRLSDATITFYERLRGPDGATLPRASRDAEAVAADPAGGYLVSFERDHRVARFAEVGAPEGEAFRARGWRGMQLNSGIESLAVAPDGVVYAFKEGRLPDRHGTPAWVVGGSGEVAFRLPLWNHDYVTAADFGPGGALYVLERRFDLITGFTVKIQRYPRLPEDDEDLAPPELLLTLTAADGSDNFEALQVWRDVEGRTRLTLASDDNFNALQRTILAEFLLRED